MNSKLFIESIIEVVRDSTISDIVDNLKEPPGRKPNISDIELSHWFLKLSSEDVENIKKIITYSVDGSIFGLLSVIDGVRTFEDNGNGKLELIYKDTSENILLNNPKNEYLHDCFMNLKK